MAFRGDSCGEPLKDSLGDSGIPASFLRIAGGRLRLARLDNLLDLNEHHPHKTDHANNQDDPQDRLESGREQVRIAVEKGIETDQALVAAAREEEDEDGDEDELDDVDGHHEEDGPGPVPDPLPLLPSLFRLSRRRFVNAGTEWSV